MSGTPEPDAVLDKLYAQFTRPSKTVDDSITEALDGLVHDVASKHASNINNQGHEAQIKYLLENGITDQDMIESLPEAGGDEDA